jgi:hypothetical protein
MGEAAGEVNSRNLPPFWGWGGIWGSCWAQPDGLTGNCESPFRLLVGGTSSTVLLAGDNVFYRSPSVIIFYYSTKNDS